MSQCRKLSAAEAYARLLAMRRGELLDVGGQVPGGLGIINGQVPGMRGAMDKGGLGIVNGQVQPGGDREAIPVTITGAAAGPTGAGQGSVKNSVKDAVQNFRNILIDIEKQQALQSRQLKRLVKE